MLRRGGTLIPDSTRAFSSGLLPTPTAATPLSRSGEHVIDADPMGELPLLPRTLDQLGAHQPAQQPLDDRIRQTRRLLLRPRFPAPTG